MAHNKSSFQNLDLAQKTHDAARRCVREIMEVSANTTPIGVARENPIYDPLFKRLDTLRKEADAYEAKAIALFEEEQKKEREIFELRRKQCAKWAMTDKEAGVAVFYEPKVTHDG